MKEDIWTTIFPPFPENMVLEIELGTLPLMVLGVIEYGDQFESTYPPIHFCFRYHVEERHFDSCIGREAPQ